MIVLFPVIATSLILTPRDILQIAVDTDLSFAWSKPAVSHLSWDYRRVVWWVRNVADGKEDRRQIGAETKIIEGGTIGPAPRS